MPLIGLALTKTALDGLATIPYKTRARVLKKVKALQINPHPPGSMKLKGTAKNDEPVYRDRSGDYRILYVVRDNPHEVIVLDVGNRKEIYR